MAGLFVGGALLLFGLLYLALRDPNILPLAEYCDENADRCAVVGEADAPITLIEVSDFGCPHCRSFHQTTAPSIIEEYVETGQAKWVFVPYALSDTTLPAANAAMCAKEQDAFFEFTEAMFAQESQQESLTQDGFLAAAETAGLDTAPFSDCVINGRYNNTIRANQQAARNIRVTGTPTFFINGEKLGGNQPFSSFVQQFEQILNS